MGTSPHRFSTVLQPAANLLAVLCHGAVELAAVEYGFGVVEADLAAATVEGSAVALLRAYFY